MKKTIQNKVLRQLLLSGKKETIESIKKITDLDLRQVYDAITSLRRRRLIKVYREISGKIGYKNPPRGTIKFEVDEKQLKYIKGLIK